MKLLKELEDYKNILKEKKFIEKRLRESRSKIVRIDTMIIFERPTTEEKLLKLIKRTPKKYLFLDLRLYNPSREEKDIYLVGEIKKILDYLKEIAKKIEMLEESRMEGVGISFIFPKFTVEDFLNL